MPYGLVLRQVADSFGVPSPWVTSLFTEAEIEQEALWLSLEAETSK